MICPPGFDAFLDASAVVTGYDRAALLGTGSAEVFWNFISQGAVDATLLERFLAPGGAEDAACAGLAAAVIELWYLGSWKGVDGDEPEHVVSTRGYREGLVWDAIGAHPMGAKQQGFGAWSRPPTQAG